MGRRIVVKGGDLTKPLSGSAVTLDGRTLEEYLDEEEGKELKEKMTPENLALYRKNRARLKEHKESNGTTRILTRREINAENWEKDMENQKTIEGVIASLLLSGREVSGSELQNNSMRQLGIPKKEYTGRSTYLFNKTDFGKFIEKRRGGKGFSRKLVPAALELKVEELMHFVYKGNPKGREMILEHHKGLRPYLESNKAKVSDLLEETKEKFKKIKDARTDGIATAISKAVSQELGVKVSVTGRVEIVFKLE